MMQRTEARTAKNIQVPPDFIMQAERMLKSQDPKLQFSPEMLKAFSEEFYADLIFGQSEALNSAPLCIPISEPQKLAFDTPADETYFGGRAGCGKTFLLIMLGSMAHKRSIIYRKEYTQLDDIIDKSNEILGQTGASFNGKTNAWRNIPGGRYIKFGACQYDKDINKFRGREYDLVAFDEIATFTEKQYLSLCAWARTMRPGQRVRVVGAGNPPLEPEYYWVKQRWAAWVDEKHVNPALPGELRWFTRIDDKDVEVAGPEPIEHKNRKGEIEILTPKSRTFIPGVMLEQLKADYTATLQQTKEPLRSQLLYGDFTLVEDDQALQVIPTAHVRAAVARWEAESSRPDDENLRALSVDVARGGEDQTVICKRYGYWFAELEKHSGKDTRVGSEVAALVENNLESDEKNTLIVIDVAGIGSSPCDYLSDLGYDVEAFNGATKSNYKDAAGRLGFINRRAEAWWMFAEALDPDSGEDICLPPDPELIADLTSATWKLTPRGIQIEKKEDIKKRLGRSPDCGDAVVMNYNADVRASTTYF